MSKISLMKCKKGDILISKHNKAFMYDHYDKKSLYPHVIFDALTGKNEHSRITSGHVFKNNRKETDDDIVKIISIIAYNVPSFARRCGLMEINYST